MYKLLIALLALFFFSSLNAQVHIEPHVTAYGATPLSGFDVSNYDIGGLVGVGGKSALKSGSGSLYGGVAFGYVSDYTRNALYIPTMLEGRYYLGDPLFLSGTIGSYWKKLKQISGYNPTFAIGVGVGWEPFNETTSFNVQGGLLILGDQIRVTAGIGI